MNLEQKSTENLAFILNELAEKLAVVNRFIMEPEEYHLDHYDDLKSMYEMVMARETLSPSEIQALITELSSFRKSK